jgi:anti-sigma factor RsiW
MTCREWQQQLGDLAAGDLDPGQARRCREHVRQCKGCARDWADYQRVRRLARQLPVDPLPDGLARQLQALLAQVQATSCT